MLSLSNFRLPLILIQLNYHKKSNCQKPTTPVFSSGSYGLLYENIEESTAKKATPAVA